MMTTEEAWRVHDEVNEISARQELRQEQRNPAEKRDQARKRELLQKVADVPLSVLCPNRQYTPDGFLVPGTD